MPEGCGLLRARAQPGAFDRERGGHYLEIVNASRNTSHLLLFLQLSV